MVGQNKRFSFKIKRQAKNVFPRDVERTVGKLLKLKMYTRWNIPVGILYKSIAGRYRPVRVADGPITARYRFIKNASWDVKRYLFFLNFVPQYYHDISVNGSTLVLDGYDTNTQTVFVRSVDTWASNTYYNLDTGNKQWVK